MAYDEETAARVRKLLSRRPAATEKKMMGGLCFMVTGRMCCSVSGKGGLLVRVGAQAQQSTLGEPHVSPMVMGGRTMTGFVRVAPEGYRTEAALAAWIKRGLDVVATMPSGASAQTSPRRKAPRRLQPKQRDRAPRN
jgi:TfoX/Sxy family transcriptional regulator of competence genes